MKSLGDSGLPVVESPDHATFAQTPTTVVCGHLVRIEDASGIAGRAKQID
jgi:hypothetical protein